MFYDKVIKIMMVNKEKGAIIHPSSQHAEVRGKGRWVEVGAGWMDSQRATGTNNNISLTSCGLIFAVASGDPAGVGASYASLITLLLVSINLILLLYFFHCYHHSSYIYIFVCSSFVIV